MMTAVSKLKLLRNTNDSIFNCRNCQTDVTPITDIRMTKSLQTVKAES